jgi:pimeloyl-ACP methyl ester carboxylesterase
MSGPPADFTIQLLRQPSSREWVVLLPGAGATTSVWVGQVRAFARHFNVALVDFPGHQRRARSAAPPRIDDDEEYHFDRLVTMLAAALDRAGVGRCHVVALSLGTILARAWAVADPKRLQSAVLAGTIADLTSVTRFLLRGGWYLRQLMPYMMLYRIYAWIIMPGPSHRKTRQRFYRDARHLGRREFNRWFNLSAEVPSLLRTLRHRPTLVPTLHVMGAGDRMFLGEALRLAADDHSELHVIQNAGHVCTVEAPHSFNAVALEFLRRHHAPARADDDRDGDRN